MYGSLEQLIKPPDQRLKLVMMTKLSMKKFDSGLYVIKQSRKLRLATRDLITSRLVSGNICRKIEEVQTWVTRRDLNNTTRVSKTMETEYDQVLRSVAQVNIADQIGESDDVERDGNGVKVSCFTEVFDDVTIQFQIIRLAKQVPANKLSLSNTVSVTSVLGGTSDNTGSGIARRLVLKTGLNIILACNIPKNNPLLEAKAEKVLIRKLIDLGYTMSKPVRAT
ncbi:F21D18.10 [Arabidopsis thaliana]|uniref:F21D18.10 n=1 Tax=Arabidopsis thaliana TaxID=3702 RepID=Q9LNH0_ARATH|nr:F21D18.10 [Arabidopsis thaliana]